MTKRNTALTLSTPGDAKEYIRDAEKLAASAEKFAEFHSMRAAELQGK